LEVVISLLQFSSQAIQSKSFFSSFKDAAYTGKPIVNIGDEIGRVVVNRRRISENNGNAQSAE
jgi:hypothetical protein